MSASCLTVAPSRRDERADRGNEMHGREAAERVLSPSLLFSLPLSLSPSVSLIHLN